MPYMVYPLEALKAISADVLRQPGQFFRKARYSTASPGKVQISDIHNDSDFFILKFANHRENAIPILVGHGVARRIVGRRIEDDHRFV